MRKCSIAFLVLTIAMAPLAARADAVSDQKKAFKAAGYHGYDEILNRKPNSDRCKLLSKSEAEHFLGKPVGKIEPDAITSGCAYHAADGSGDGLLVSRDPNRSSWYPTSQDRAVSGVGEKAYTNTAPPPPSDRRRYLRWRTRTLCPKKASQPSCSKAKPHPPQQLSPRSASSSIAEG